MQVELRMVIHPLFPLHWIQEGSTGKVKDGDSPALLLYWKILGKSYTMKISRGDIFANGLNS